MIKKSMRTKEKYAKAAAELDVLEKCLRNSNNAMELLPAKEIDYLCNLIYKISMLKIILENNAAKDYGSTDKIVDLFCGLKELKNEFDDYKLRRNELISSL